MNKEQINLKIKKMFKGAIIKDIDIMNYTVFIEIKTNNYFMPSYTNIIRFRYFNNNNLYLKIYIKDLRGLK